MLNSGISLYVIPHLLRREKNMSVFQITVAILIISIIVSFLYGLFTRNYSTVDRLWSILPPVYVLVWMSEYMHNTRFVIAGILVIAWGVRLSLNFARRGGYTFKWGKGFTGEDYRWEIMREKIPGRFMFELFNLFFISIFQLVLVFIITLPLYFVAQNNAPLNRIDIVLFVLHFLFLLGETISDNQQYRFQSDKRRAEFQNSTRHQLGYNTFGLWKFSRHPNYFFEIGQWVIVACYALNTGVPLSRSVPGALLLILLFIGSTNLTESITAAKYPSYAQWRKASAAWLPLPVLKGKKRQKFLNI